MSRIQNLILHNAKGESISEANLINWNPSPWRPFNTISVSWMVDGKRYSITDTEKLIIRTLPGEGGFICFESVFKPNNCYVLDVYGHERYRLTVPWELTPYEVPPGAKMWFRGIGTHPDGHFGVTAWIEYAGDFYFELDYHEGRFLWGKEIRF